MDLVQAGKLTEEQAREYLERIRWPEGPICPHCGKKDVTRLQGESARAGTLQCNDADCRQQFTVTLGTVMEDTHLPLQKWVMAFHLLCSSKKGISTLQLQRQLGLGSYRTAWHLAHRIRHAMQKGPDAPKLQGTIEVDETYVGGKPPKLGRGKSKGYRKTKKVPVVALVQREGPIVVRPVQSVTAKTLKGLIRRNVRHASRINTDELPSYQGIGIEFEGGHGTVCHIEGEYCRGNDHVNTAESFFALLKRGLHGSFHHVSKHHLFRYCDEFSFRWDHRKATDGERTVAAISQAEGKRLKYA